MNKDFLTGLAFLTPGVLALYGWIANIVILLANIGGTIDQETIWRVLGIILFPIGVVMGYL